MVKDSEWQPVIDAPAVLFIWYSTHVKENNLHQSLKLFLDVTNVTVLQKAHT